MNDVDNHHSFKMASYHPFIPSIPLLSLMSRGLTVLRRRTVASTTQIAPKRICRRSPQETGVAELLEETTNLKVSEIIQGEGADPPALTS